LQGRDGYRVETEPWTPAHLLTDWTKIIPWGIYEVYKENPELGLDKMIEDAILEMMDGEPFDIYVALTLVYFQLLSEHYDKSSFIIDRNKVLKKLRQTLINNKEKLMNYFEWTCGNYEGGAWGEVVRINELCKDDNYKVSQLFSFCLPL
jgi:hypothetical protein